MSWNPPPPPPDPGYWQGAPQWQQPPPGTWLQQPLQHPSGDWQTQPSQAWNPAPPAVPYQPPNPHPIRPPQAPPLPASAPPAPVPVPSVAYTSVAPKKALTAQPAQPSDKTAAWPSALRSYVERSFAVPHLDRSKLQSELANVINTAKRKGDLWSRDWDHFPLPLSEPQPQNNSSTPAVSFAINKPARIKASLAVERPIQKKGKQQSPKQSPLAKSNMEPKLTKKQRKAQQKLIQQQLAQQKQKAAQQKAAAKQQRQAENFQMDERDLWKAAERSRRFGDGTTPGAVQWQRQQDEYVDLSYNDAVEGIDVIGNGPAVRGTCQNIEKSYFRLTSKPDPSSVRPEPVLQMALNRLVQLIKSGNRQCNYFYASDQLKGMRQDCTVQHLQNELSARIYEAHARCALENGDVGEFNQCQGQLQQHYEAGIPGCKHEFLAYRILYQAAHAGKGQHFALLTCLQSISPEDAEHPSVKHALKVREAIAMTDHIQVSKLYSEAPNMGKALLDIVIPKVRLTGLKVFVKAHLPEIPVQAIAERLGFVPSSSSECKPSSVVPVMVLPGCSVADYKGKHAMEVDYNRGLECCLAWAKSCGAVMTGPQGVAVNCKASQGQLHMPVVAKPVGPDLAIEDFLSRTLM